MTKPAILARAARGRLAERAEELRPGALRLGQITGVTCPTRRLCLDTET
jgi:hypothetical protein